MELVATIPQMDGGVRYLLDSDARAARENRAAIRDTGCVDAAEPEYIVDRYGDRLSASRYPGKKLTTSDWSAIRQAIHTEPLDD